LAARNSSLTSSAVKWWPFSVGFVEEVAHRSGVHFAGIGEKGFQFFQRSEPMDSF
jgi:hypothetical protein